VWPGATVAESGPQRRDVTRLMFRIAGRYALINALIAIPLHLLIHAAGFGGSTATWKQGVAALAVVGVVVAPIMETFLHFWLPIVVVRKVLGQRSVTPFVARLYVAIRLRALWRRSGTECPDCALYRTGGRKLFLFLFSDR